MDQSWEKVAEVLRFYESDRVGAGGRFVTQARELVERMARGELVESSAGLLMPVSKAPENPTPEQVSRGAAILRDLKEPPTRAKQTGYGYATDAFVPAPAQRVSANTLAGSKRERCLFMAQELAEAHDLDESATDEVADLLFDERAAVRAAFEAVRAERQAELNFKTQLGNAAAETVRELRTELQTLQSKHTALIAAAREALEWLGVRNMSGTKQPLCSKAHAAHVKLAALLVTETQAPERDR